MVSLVSLSAALMTLSVMCQPAAASSKGNTRRAFQGPMPKDEALFSMTDKITSSAEVIGPVPFAAAASVPSVEVQAHMQNRGWLSVVKNGATAGVTGKGLRLEDVKIRLTNADGGIKISTHQSNVGWVSYTSAKSGSWCESGSVGKERAIEAVKIQLYGNIASQYDIVYRVHSQDKGWLPWVKNNQIAGTTGLGLRAEALEVKLVKKKNIIDDIVNLIKPEMTYCAHIQDKGTMGWVKEGSVSGSVGNGLRLEGFWVNLKGYDGKSGISYRAHVSDIGWMGWKSSGQMSGTSGQSKAIECVQMKLSANLAKYYDLYYRVHVEDYGWLGYAKNGESAGTVGGGYRVEAIQIKLVRKGASFNRGGSAYKDLTNTVLVTAANINKAAEDYGIAYGTNAYAALKSINSKYLANVSGNKNGTNIFFFEGCGNNATVTRRYDAMCVVVKNRQIVYISQNSSTIPDAPFTPSKNGGTPMPTIKSGVYNFKTVNHRGSYAALNVTGAKVVRHRNKTNYYSSTSDSINVHRRSADSITNSWVNSAGCLIVGSTPANQSGTTNEYARFIQAVGIVGANGKSNQTYTSSVTGKIIVDRTYAGSYLKNIGYSDGAIAAIG